jgi:hypothetical protein
MNSCSDNVGIVRLLKSDSKVKKHVARDPLNLKSHSKGAGSVRALSVSHNTLA